MSNRRKLSKIRRKIRNKEKRVKIVLVKRCLKSQARSLALIKIREKSPKIWMSL